MDSMQWLVVVIFFATFIGLLTYQRAPERVFSVATLACLAGTFVTTNDVLANATNPGLVTLIFLVICSFSFERTSVLRRISVIINTGSATKTLIKGSLT